MLRAICVVSLVLCGVSLAGCGGSEAIAGPVEINAGYGFKVEIDGMTEAWTRAEGLAFTISFVNGRVVSGATSTPDGSAPTTIKLMTPVDGDKIPNVKDWVKEVYDGKDVRKDITIEILDPTGTTIRTFFLPNASPVRFGIMDVDTGNSDVLHWTLEVRVNRIDMA